MHLLEYLQAQILKISLLIANHGHAFMGSLYIWVFPKKHWIRHWKPKVKEIEKTKNIENIVYKTNGYTYSSKIFRTIKTFDKDIYDNEINLKEADEDQNSLSVEILNIRKQIKHINPERIKQQKGSILKNLHTLFTCTEMVLYAFESRIFPINKIKCTDFSDFNHSYHEILPPRQLLQR